MSETSNDVKHGRTWPKPPAERPFQGNVSANAEELRKSWGSSKIMTKYEKGNDTLREKGDEPLPEVALIWRGGAV